MSQDSDLARVEIPHGDGSIRGAGFRHGKSRHAADPDLLPIVELRQRTLHPGNRDVLIHRFGQWRLLKITAERG
jgi:hypothetical protein